MKLKKYGITLERLKEGHIEMVRKWRNANRDKMEFKEYITPEMQKEWFRKINNYNNFYYLIEYNGEYVGVISEKDINESRDHEDAGIFMFGEKYQNSHIPVLASLLLIENAFYIVESGDSFIHIMKDNQQAIKYNTGLGYVLCEGQEDKMNQKYILTKENFEKKTKKVRKAALKLSGGDNTTICILEKEDYLPGGVGHRMEQFMLQLRNKSTVEEKNGEKIFSIKPAPSI